MVCCELVFILLVKNRQSKYRDGIVINISNMSSESVSLLQKRGFPGFQRMKVRKLLQLLSATDCGAALIVIKTFTRGELPRVPPLRLEQV